MCGQCNSKYTICRRGYTDIQFPKISGKLSVCANSGYQVPGSPFPPTESMGTKLMYTMVTIFLIDHLGVIVDVKQTWYDDNATAAEILHSTRCWWNHLVSVGPVFGYHAHASKTWLLMKEEHLDQAKIIFQGTRQYHHPWLTSLWTCSWLQEI